MREINKYEEECCTPMDERALGYVSPWEEERAHEQLELNSKNRRLVNGIFEKPIDINEVA